MSFLIIVTFGDSNITIRKIATDLDKRFRTRLQLPVVDKLPPTKKKLDGILSQLDTSDIDFSARVLCRDRFNKALFRVIIGTYMNKTFRRLI